ncbi:hypothetical protein D3C80_406940 [compost metagenome]
MLPDRLIEAHRLAQRVERFRGGVFAQHHHRSVGGQDLGNGKDDQRHDKKRVDDHHQPLGYVVRRQGRVPWSRGPDAIKAPGDIGGRMDQPRFGALSESEA